MGVSIEAITQMDIVIVIVSQVTSPLFGVLMIVVKTYGVPLAWVLVVPEIVNTLTERVTKTGKAAVPLRTTLVIAVISLQGVYPG